ncbi:GntR family transcriptional regulator [Acetivibrio sp. MSJd-27]|jgi:transcriptional regulator, gntR family|uniref:GntR family transcriptional regulator n=1 Tax=Acetivibrio sp. MSJd-27 TaxID=2841523 RepID=UPI0015A99E80|nr:GntR family transcriptional regulator [Acetivibrio sp. MSJd-27]MBU5450228.1 GntR family transcriptional regulator [Acetivibrio sp. MSJd-27]
MKKIEWNHASLGGKVFEAIEQAILGGTYAAGDSLTELGLSAELGVSRTPVREALRQLELEGLVQSVPNKGTVVVGISQKDIEDIYTIRMSIEGLACEWAAQKINGKELEKLKEIIELQEFYAQKNDVLQVWQLDRKFHETIYDASRSRPLKHTLTNFHNYIQKARELSFKSGGRTALSVKEHRDIYEAVAQHDGEKARVLTRQHIANARENFLNHISQER